VKFSIQKNIFQNLLLEHGKVVPLRTTLPILSCASFEVKKNELLIKTTDLDQTIISSTEIQNEEEGAVAVPVVKLTEIISALPEEEIRISTNEDFLIEINSNSGSYKITGRSAQEYPEKPNTEKGEKITLKGLELLNIINKTAYATSKDDLKPALTGVYFNIKNGRITAVSTDGHKLVKYEKEFDNKKTPEQSIIIPSKFLNILKNTIKEKEETTINVSDNHILTKHQKFVFISRIIKEKFPDFNSVIPEENKTKCLINAGDFLSSVKRIGIFSNRTTKQIVLTFCSNGVVLSAEDPETAASGKEHYMCSFEGEEITTSYNAKYLQETIQHIGQKEVEIYLNTPLSAAIIKPKEEKEKEKLTTLLMPLRLNKK